MRTIALVRFAYARITRGVNSRRRGESIRHLEFASGVTRSRSTYYYVIYLPFFPERPKSELQNFNPGSLSDFHFLIAQISKSRYFIYLLCTKGYFLDKLISMLLCNA